MSFAQRDSSRIVKHVPKHHKPALLLLLCCLGPFATIGELKTELFIGVFMLKTYFFKAKSIQNMPKKCERTRKCWFLIQKMCQKWPFGPIWPKFVSKNVSKNAKVREKSTFWSKKRQKMAIHRQYIGKGGQKMVFLGAKNVKKWQKRANQREKGSKMAPP